MAIKTYQLQTLTCPSCIKRIEKALGTQPEVEDVKVLFSASKVKVIHAENADTDVTRQTIESLGYEVISEK